MALFREGNFKSGNESHRNSTAKTSREKSNIVVNIDISQRAVALVNTETPYFFHLCKTNEVNGYRMIYKGIWRGVLLFALALQGPCTEWWLTIENKSSTIIVIIQQNFIIAKSSTTISQYVQYLEEMMRKKKTAISKQNCEIENTISEQK